jgi:hypothetical protein
MGVGFGLCPPLALDPPRPRPQPPDTTGCATGLAKWARTFTASPRLLRGAALEASAIAGADADEESGRRHFAALAAFHAATAVAWAAGGEERAARRAPQTDRSFDRAVHEGTALREGAVQPAGR